MIPRTNGRWTLPGGGIEFGEDPADAVVREVFEETSLEARIDRLAGIHSVSWERAGRPYHNVHIVYHMRILGGELTVEVDGSTDMVSWWSKDEVRGLPQIPLVGFGFKHAFPTG